MQVPKKNSNKNRVSKIFQGQMISPYRWYGWFIPYSKVVGELFHQPFPPGAELWWFPSVLCCGASPKRRGASVRGLRGRGPCGCSEICRKLDFERMTLVAAGRGPQNRRWWLVGGLEPWNFMTFHILGIVTPTDFHIFRRGWNHQPEYVGRNSWNTVDMNIWQ